jgi:hypothetical protein
MLSDALVNGELLQPDIPAANPFKNRLATAWYPQKRFACGSLIWATRAYIAQGPDKALASRETAPGEE